MPNVDVDADGLRDAANLLAELHTDLGGVSAQATKFMGRITEACGDDHFGRKFTEGKDGFRTKCNGARKNVDAITKSFGEYSESVGGPRGAATAHELNDDDSGGAIRRAV